MNAANKAETAATLWNYSGRKKKMSPFKYEWLKVTQYSLS